MKSNLSIILYLSLTFLITACSAKTEQQKMPVLIYNGYQPPAALPESIKATSVANIRKIISAKWEEPIKVVSEKNPDVPFMLSSCEDYLKHSNQNLETIPLMYNRIFMQDTIRCEATKVISSGLSSKRSFLKNVDFNINLPAKLPPQMAQIISTEESKRILNNKNITSWAQVDPVLKIEKQSPYRTKYFIEGGSELLQLAAKGDFNHDGIEDMLVIINDAVEGGSYSATRLFLLTRLKSKGKIILLEQWPKE